MSALRLSRRRLLHAAGAALPLAASASLLPAATAPAGMTIGLATLGFSKQTNEEVAREVAGAGVRLVQLFFNQTDSRYWKYNGRSDLADMTPARAEKIAAAYRAAGVTIHSIGVYTNLIHAEPAERAANLDYFEGMMRLGQAMGVKRFVTEAGHWHSEKPNPGVEHHFQEAIWTQMVGTAQELARRADKYDATILFEPFYRGFLASAKRVRLFLEAINSPRCKALLDPANLLEMNDLEEMFGQLKPWIECIHAKDRKLHVDRGVPAGQGDLDYPKFVRLAWQNLPQVPLVLEYVGQADYRQALAHLRSTMQQVGVPEAK